MRKKKIDDSKKNRVFYGVIERIEQSPKEKYIFPVKKKIFEVKEKQKN